jgi:hypothetical protein
MVLPQGEGTMGKSWLLPLLVFVVVGACVAYGITLSALIPAANDRAAFGEMFGGLGAAFAGLAFGGLVFSLRQQAEMLAQARRDIAAQEKSTADLRDQMARTAQLNGLGVLAAVYMDANKWAAETSHTDALVRSAAMLETVVTEVEDLCERPEHYF